MEKNLIYRTYELYIYNIIEVCVYNEQFNVQIKLLNYNKAIK